MRNVVYILCKTLLAAALLIVLTGCAEQHPAVAKEPVKLSGWLAYWDLAAGEKDLTRIDKRLDSLSYFAAYFDKDDKLIIPAELNDQRAALKEKKVRYKTYLTFVNDKQNADGSVIMKDIEVLRRLFADDTAKQKHIDEILSLTLQGGYDGIEIDYEQIWKDPLIGEAFLRFSDKLYQKALEKNLKLRLVLEPRTPFITSNFVNGPEYVVMLYNLYGTHSGPGPKANAEFIKNTLFRMKFLPGKPTAAFSTGGCLWGDNGEKRFITEAEAKTLAVLHDAKPKRDPDSQAQVFSYQEQGVSYQVWYADVKTLKFWIALAGEQAVTNISLWRLGGNLDINKI